MKLSFLQCETSNVISILNVYTTIGEIQVFIKMIILEHVFKWQIMVTMMDLKRNMKIVCH